MVETVYDMIWVEMNHSDSFRHACWIMKSTNIIQSVIISYIFQTM